MAVSPGHPAIPEPAGRGAAPPPTIVLMGPRACGKSTIGRLLAGHLGREFDDLDDLVRGRFGGLAISEIWSLHGETAFREAEADALSDLLALPGSTPGPHPKVIALGGGTPMVERARQALETARRSGQARIVLVLAAPSVLAARIGADLRSDPGGRPSLTGAAPDREIASVLAQRLPVYRALADLEVHSDRSSPEELVERVAAWLEKR